MKNEWDIIVIGSGMGGMVTAAALSKMGHNVLMLGDPVDRNPFFHVFKHGRLTVIGFDARHVDSPAAAPQCQQELLDLVDDEACDILAVELMGLGVVSSWILGILAAVRARGIEIHLYHPTGELKDGCN